MFIQNGFYKKKGAGNFIKELRYIEGVSGEVHSTKNQLFSILKVSPENGDKLINLSGHTESGTITEVMPEKKLLIDMLIRMILDAHQPVMIPKRDVRRARIWLRDFGVYASEEGFSCGWVCEHISDRPVTLQRMIVKILDDEKGFTVAPRDKAI